eukprot:scaffold158464_cov49-Attheya_sp.AAC.1
MGNRSSCRGGGVLTSCLPSHTKKEDMLLREEREREEGQALLRSMVEANQNDVDWAAVIAKAQELHMREQSLMQKRRRNQSFASRHKNRRDLARRRRKDAVGSFSVNLLTYRQDGTVPENAIVDDDDDGPSVGTSDRSSGGTRHTGDTIAGDTSSLNSYYSSSSLVDFANTSSWDEEGMTRIDETNVLY